MAVLSKVARRVDIPHEPGEWMEVLELSNVDLMACRRDAWKAIAFDFVGDEEMKEEQVDFETGVLLLERGIVAWSYDAECSTENKRNLDSKTMMWAIRMIRNDDTAEDQEKGSGPSPTI